MTESEKYLATRYKELQDKKATALEYSPGDQEETEAWQTWIGEMTNELAAMEDEYDSKFGVRPPPPPPPPPPWWGA